MTDTPTPEDLPDGPDESGVGDPDTPSDAGNAEIGDGQTGPDESDEGETEEA